MKKLIIILLTLVCFTNLFALDSDVKEYFVIYTKKVNNTQKRLTYLNKKNAIAKMGTETIEGLISGTLFYDVKVKGLGAEVIMRYENFCEEEGWIFNGEIITTANMSQNGTIAGIIEVTGDTNAKIIYDKVVVKSGKPGNGTYGVLMENKELQEVPYTCYFEAE